MAAITRGLEAEAYDRQYSDKELVRRMGSYFRPHRRKIIIIVIALTLIAAANAAVPLLVAWAVNLMTTADSSNLGPLLVGAVLALGIAIWSFNWVRRLLMVEVVQDVVLAMRQDAFAAAARQDMSFYDEFSSGRVVSRITSDTQEFGEVLMLSADVLNQLAVAVILIAILFTIEWKLTLAVLIMAPFVTLVALGFRGLARRTTRQGTRAMGEVNKSIQEAVTGIRVAKNFRQEQAIYEAFGEINQQAYDINVRRGFVLANIFPVLNALAGVGTAVIIYFGGLAAVAGAISAAAWYLFISTVDRFWFPVTNLSAFWSQFQAGLSAMERVFALMDVETAVTQTDNQPVLPLRGEITFQHVSFRYSAQEQVLDDFSLTIAPGESVALVGHTGAGKSSIIKLTARFYEFQEGEIWIDGRDIRTLNLHDFRRQLGIVSQAPFLFAGTVAENIRYGRPEASDAAIEAIARQIGDGEWLETLPDGLLSDVGERGSRLSLGQRQLVALTRVLLQDPRIFILDEATASVDPFTESQIQQALHLIMGRRTSIIIAHRLSTVRTADRIVVLRKGRIIEQGSHEGLMVQGGHYAELYDTYFRHQSTEYLQSLGQWRATVKKN
ncbi:MAG: ABC transporter ATP-binding protein [Chloroflexi bacterium]|nr:ABC transporter ATP-binding protein [Chloroflexota bacterium]NOG34669.1 ABC transporter ATP-binding protein [Chloroflexota bacterium]GIK57731.1 MAG: ABC transporter [Chloroflexota bacterium]